MLIKDANKRVSEQWSSFMVEKYRTYHGHGNRNLEFSGGQGECGRLGELARTSPDVQILTISRPWGGRGLLSKSCQERRGQGLSKEGKEGVVARTQRTRSRVARDVNRRSGRLGPPPSPSPVGVKCNSVGVKSESCKCHHLQGPIPTFLTAGWPLNKVSHCCRPPFLHLSNGYH